MAKIEEAAQPPAGQTESSQLLSIRRDANFVRISADDIIVVHRGRDIQVSLIAEGPEPIKQALPGVSQNGFAVQEVQFAATYTEIARIGLPSGPAFNMAMNIIETAVEAGRLPIKRFRERFLAMLDEHEKTDIAEQAESPPASRES